MTKTRDVLNFELEDLRFVWHLEFDIWNFKKLG